MKKEIKILKKNADSKGKKYFLTFINFIFFLFKKSRESYYGTMYLRRQGNFCYQASFYFLSIMPIFLYRYYTFLFLLRICILLIDQNCYQS